MTGAAVAHLHHDDLAPLAELIAGRRATHEHDVLLVGLAGGVGVGKSMAARAVATHLAERHGVRTTVVSSDGFLFPNAELARRGLTTRKGFPESYDTAAIEAFLDAVRAGADPLLVPLYDHLFYDVRPEQEEVASAPVVVLEGVNVLHFADRLDLTVYVDAAEPDMRRWFVQRVIQLRDEAAGVEGAYLAPFADLDDDAMASLAVSVWEAINLPNLLEAIEPTRDRADVVVVKGPRHEVAEIVVR